MRLSKVLAVCCMTGTFYTNASLAQELNCKVTINAQQVQTTERQVFQEIENAVTQFLNNRKWTQDNFTIAERIQCNMLITLLSVEGIGRFKANTQIQVLRPIYGTSYSSLVFNFLDPYWTFDYAIGQQMDFNDNQYITNLTAMLGFYAYFMLGMDYDTFSKLGGSPYFEKALVISNYSSNSGNTGWAAFENNRNNNRHWLMENILNSQFTPLREGMYTLHRMVLDTYNEEPDKGRDLIVAMLKELSKLNMLRPGSVMMNTFFDTKAAELINLLKDGTPEQRSEAAQLLSGMDPTKTEQYMKLVGQ